MTEAEKALLMAVAGALQLGRPDVKAAIAKVYEELEQAAAESETEGGSTRRHRK